MDHLPYPQDPAWPLIEIPYICAELEEYDGLDFINYPVRRGWSQTAHGAQWMDCPWETSAKRAQNWLYFGLLHEFIGPGYKKELFLRQNPNNNGYVIDTSRLPDILRHRSRSVRGNWFQVFRPNADLEFSTRCRDMFWETDIQSERLDQSSSYCRIITLGIKVLLQSLQNAVSGSAIAREEKSINETNPILRARLLYFKMVHAGWCSSQAIWLIHNYSAIMVNYLAALPRRFVGLNHKDCDANVCVANNVDEETYQTAHTTEHCRCEFRGPNEASVIQLIKEDMIPLISVAIMPDDTPRIDVVKAEPGVVYTAISHVWSGGLGNPVENKLPTCQILKMYRLLAEIERQKLPKRKSGFGLLWHRFSNLKKKFRWQNLTIGSQTRYFPISMEFSDYREYTPAIFWIDTLCVPVGKPFRVQAIRSMDLIYAAAENTLVLDSELQQISRTSQEQMSAHVLCSSWMGRCWTLQEARFSQRCYVQFADGLFDIQNTERLVYKDLNDAARNYAWTDLTDFKLESIVWYYAMIPMRDPLYEVPFDGRGQFLNEWSNLEQRSTSRKEDALCIFASMLGLNGGDILALPNGQRMKAILRAQTSLPLDLLFLLCPRMEEVSCEWIPSYPAFGTSLDGNYGKMKVTTEGVVFDKSTANWIGFLVASSMPRLDRFCLQENSDSEPLWVTVRSDGTDSGFRSSTSIATCYIFGKFGKSDGVKPSLFERGVQRSGGARFAVQRREGRMLHLSYESPMSCNSSQPFTYDNQGQSVVDQSDFPLLDAEVLQADQIFQIDCGKPFHDASSDSHTFLTQGKQIAKFDDISDVGSWPEVGNRRHLVRDATQESGYDFYSYAGMALVFSIWAPFLLLSALSIRKSVYIATMGGPITILCVRGAFLFAERRMIFDSIDRHTRSMYTQSFARLGLRPDAAGRTWSSAQFKAWHVALAMIVALVLFVLGVTVPSQRWALWMGLSIPVEITIRLVIEFLWRNTRFGDVLKSWLKQRGWW